MQWVHEQAQTRANRVQNSSELLELYATIHLFIISPSVLGMFQAALFAQSLARYFAVCTVGSAVVQDFKSVLFALWCWHLKVFCVLV